jgi:hypothetical protein
MSKMNQTVAQLITQLDSENSTLRAQVGELLQLTQDFKNELTVVRARCARERSNAAFWREKAFLCRENREGYRGIDA